MIAWILMPVGILMIIYSEKISQLTGAIPFAERIFGNGGTYLFLKITGLLMTILSFMWVTGGIQPVLKSTFGVFFSGA
jgi:hypothetical protein